MAKEATLNIKVNDEQFQRFVKSFEDLSKQIQELTSKFNRVHQGIQKSNAAANALTSTMRTLLQTSKNLLSTVAGVTTHFMKWSVLIGGIGALLGMGGGLFGIERLAASIMQKRRMIMGLGGDYGRTQASMIYNQSVLGNPSDVMQNIRLGLGGSQEQMTSLLSMGIPFGTKMSPDIVLDKILEKLPALLRSAGPGMELQVARAYGLDKIFTDPMDLLRLTTEEGRKEIQEKRKLIEAHRKELELSKPAQKAWTDLELQFQIAKTSIESTFGEKLAKLATPLADVSAGFVKVFRTLMNTEVVDKILNKISQWLKQFSDYLDKGTVEEDIKKFLGKIDDWGGKIGEITKVLEEFGKILRVVVDVLSLVWKAGSLLNKGVDFLTGNWGGGKPATVAPVPGSMNRPGQPPGHPGPPVPPTGPGAGAPPAGAPPQAPGTPQQQRIPNPFEIFGGSPQAPNPAPPAQPPGIGILGSYIPKPGQPGSNRFAFAANNAGMYSNRNTAYGGNVNLASMTSVARRSVPGTGGGGGGGLGPGFMMANLVGRQGKKGGLDTDNWQMNRTTSLVVRNVPGANMFMSATGMA